MAFNSQPVTMEQAMASPGRKTGFGNRGLIMLNIVFINLSDFELWYVQDSKECERWMNSREGILNVPRSLATGYDGSMMSR
jgi:hypothetical protein